MCASALMLFPDCLPPSLHLRQHPGDYVFRLTIKHTSSSTAMFMETRCCFDQLGAHHKDAATCIMSASWQTDCCILCFFLQKDVCSKMEIHSFPTLMWGPAERFIGALNDRSEIKKLHLPSKENSNGAQQIVKHMELFFQVPIVEFIGLLLLVPSFLYVCASALLKFIHMY